MVHQEVEQQPECLQGYEGRQAVEVRMQVLWLEVTRQNARGLVQMLALMGSRILLKTLDQLQLHEEMWPRCLHY